MGFLANIKQKNIVLKGRGHHYLLSMKYLRSISMHAASAICHLHMMSESGMHHPVGVVPNVLTFSTNFQKRGCIFFAKKIYFIRISGEAKTF